MSIIKFQIHEIKNFDTSLLYSFFQCDSCNLFPYPCFICSQCQKVFCAECSHIYCQPNKIINIQQTLLKPEYEKIKVTCPCKCGYICDITHISQHIEKCPLKELDCQLCLAKVKYTLIEHHIEEHLNNELPINYEQYLSLSLCSKCGLPDYIDDNHHCLNNEEKSEANVIKYLVNVNQKVERKVLEFQRDYNDKCAQNKKKYENLINSINMQISLKQYSNKETDQQKIQSLLSKISIKENQINTLKDEVNTYKNLLVQSESYLNLLKIHNNNIEQFNKRINAFNKENHELINATLKNFISGYYVPEQMINNNYWLNSIRQKREDKVNEEKNKTEVIGIKCEKCTNSCNCVKCSRNFEGNLNQEKNCEFCSLICTICEKWFCHLEKEKCFSNNCSNIFCKECYYKNVWQIRTQESSCLFYTCPSCNVKNICIMSTIHCDKCDIRICNKCYREKHLNH